MAEKRNIILLSTLISCNMMNEGSETMKLPPLTRDETLRGIVLLVSLFLTFFAEKC